MDCEPDVFKLKLISTIYRIHISDMLLQIAGKHPVLILDWITICLFSTCLLPVKLTLKDNDCCEGHFVDDFETFKHSLKKVEVIIMTNNKSVHSNVISEILLLLLLIFSLPTLFRPSAAK